MPSNFTENYNLSQWERTDKVQMEDFNADNAKIDAAIKAEAEARAAGDAALQTALSKKGNCQIWVGSYKTTGLYGQNHPNSITFPKMPIFAFVIATYTAIFIPGHTYVMAHYNTVADLHLTWNGTTVSWYSVKGALEQLNTGDSIVIAFFPA